MRRYLTPLAALTAALLLGAWTHGAPAPVAGNYAYVTANASAPGYAIPDNFIGLSVNKGPGGFTDGYYVTSDTAMLTLIQSLGPSGNFRIGGTPCANSEAAPTSLASIQSLYTFLQAVGPGWTTHLIWGLNLAYPTAGANDISYAITEVGRVEATFGSGVATYVIGNEPDLYYSNVAAFQSQWSAMYSAIHAAYPSAKFAGPDTASPFSGWGSGFVSGVGSNLSMVVEHFYGTAQGGFLTPATMLSTLPAYVGQTPNRSFLQADLAASSPLPIRINEGDTAVLSGGVAGVSNSAASAAWNVDIVIALANARWNGMDFHSGYGGPTNTYLPMNATSEFSLDWSARPGWAGIALATRIAGARVAPVTSTIQGARIETLGVLTPSGNTAFLIANIDATAPVSIIPQSTGGWSTATASIVGSDSPSDLTIKINGAAMGSNGACTAACPPSVYAKGAAISIPAGGAAYILLQ